jgi:hypothetical protein
MQSQRQSVFNAVINVMGEIDGAYTPEKSERESIIDIVTESILEGETTFSEEAHVKYDSPTKVKSYVNGLVSNWLRKDTRLNGGSKYVPKNPGSRTGMQDSTVKALRQLLKTGLSEDQSSRVQEELEARLAVIRAEKAKDIEIDFDALPEGLVEELGLES